MTLVRRIYKNMWYAVLLTVLIAATLILISFYSIINNQMMVDVKDKAQILSETLNFTPINTDYLNTIGNHKDFRITYIKQDGTVLYDNMIEVEILDNHGTRPEVDEAIKNGVGNSTRKSSSIDKETYYYAIRLNDLSIIRIGQTTDTIYTVFRNLLFPIVIIAALLLIFSFLVSMRLTKNIIKPINDIDLEDENLVMYDELAPLAKKITTQKNEIDLQMKILKNRADTIKIITNNMKEGLILIDSKGIIVSANNTVNDIFNSDEVIGKNILLINRDIGFINKINKALLGSTEELLINNDGKHYAVYINPSYNEAVCDGAIILFLDITEKRKSKKQREEFTANVSHELKTPLTTILGISEMMENGMVKPDDMNRFSKKIVDESKRLLTLIEDIIKLSRIDEGNINKSYSTLNLKKAVESVITSLNDVAKLKNVDLNLDLADVFLYADHTMIYELIFNLIDNGIKYNKDGGVVLVTVKEEDGYKKIIVADTGIGIEEKYLDRIFERFYRIDKSRSKNTGGTGLGLSIAKHIVESFNGEILIDSVVDVGTTISCLFKD